MIWVNINWRTLIAAVVWMLNIAAILVYLFTFKIIEDVYSKLIYLTDCLVVMFYSTSQILIGFANIRHRAFVILSYSSLSVFFLFLILYYCFGINNYLAKIGVFLLTELITVSFVLVSGLKVGLFKNGKDLL